MPNTSQRKQTKKRFVLNAIHNLRKSGYLGIHAVFSGFNQAFRDYYGEDPIAEVDKLMKQGVVLVQPVKGGVMLYDYEEYKKSGRAKRPDQKKDSSQVIKRILEG
jgi:hypothetical protein